MARERPGSIAVPELRIGRKWHAKMTKRNGKVEEMAGEKGER